MSDISFTCSQVLKKRPLKVIMLSVEAIDADTQSKNYNYERDPQSYLEQCKFALHNHSLSPSQIYLCHDSHAITFQDPIILARFRPGNGVSRPESDLDFLLGGFITNFITIEALLLG